MKPRTTELLSRLKNAAWFIKAGTLTADDEDDAIVPVTSLVVALEVWFSKNAVGVRDEMLDALNAAASEKYGRALWLTRVDELERRVDRLVDHKLADCPALADHIDAENLPDFGKVLKTDFDILCLAWEFKEVVTTQFYEVQLQWYLRGHFPCGWVNSGRRFGGRRVGKLGVW